MIHSVKAAAEGYINWAERAVDEIGRRFGGTLRKELPGSYFELAQSQHLITRRLIKLWIIMQMTLSNFRPGMSRPAILCAFGANAQTVS